VFGNKGELKEAEEEGDEFEYLGTPLDSVEERAGEGG
jgi:hypothetical protein